MCRHSVNQFGDLANDTFHAFFFFLSLSLSSQQCLFDQNDASNITDENDDEERRKKRMRQK